MEIGLVLAGGGGKGAYQIGVWKALNEIGISKNITAISGSSIGALNTSLFMNGDYDKAENIWKNISSEKILKFDGKNLMLGSQNLQIKEDDLKYLMNKIYPNKISIHWPNITKGIFSRKGLIDIIDENLELSNISNSKILGFSTCTLMPGVLAKYFIMNGQTNEKIKSIILGSSSFPIAFGFEKIDGYSYIDGGVSDNEPINILYIHGYNNIIIVSLNHQYVVNKSKYPYANIIEIKPSKNLGNIITGTFDFDKENAILRIKQGYDDTIKIKDEIKF